MTASLPIGVYLFAGVLTVALASVLGALVSLWFTLVRAEGARDRALHAKHMHSLEVSRLRRELRWRDRGIGVWVPSTEPEPEPEIDGRAAHH